MANPDEVRLRHVLEAAALALEMATGHTQAELSRNRMLAMALVRCLEILGEAASKMSPETRMRFPSIPFAQMVSMRNRLIHAYFDGDPSVVWTTVTRDLPSLIPALDRALAELEG